MKLFAQNVLTSIDKVKIVIVLQVIQIMDNLTVFNVIILVHHVV